MGRAPCCEKVGLKRGRWTAEEDEILVKYIQANGEGSWRSLPKNAGLLRCGKSCRLRWINYLRTDLKRGNISAEEEDTIVKLHTSFGNRWSLIASHLPGRTDNEIKNYWNSHLSRKIYSFRKVAGTGIMDINRPPPPKRKGGRTSRWAMKKNKGYTYTESPKQTVTKVQNSEAAVPMPHPPSSLNNETEEGIEKVEPMDQVNTRTCEKDLDHEGTNEKETYDDIMGLFEVENSNGGGGALCFGDDMMMEDSCLLLEEACGVSTLSEERETNVGVVVGEYERMNGDGDVGPNKMASSHEDPECSGNLSSNGESTREWSSNMGLGLGLDDNYHWDWESVMEFNDCNDDDNSNNEHDAWEHKEDLLTWLWEDDDWENDSSEILGEIDLQKQNDLLIAWFLS